MQRRKFVVGMGSLAAGASAVMGTGAISESTMERGVRGRFANDKNAYISITPCPNNGQHVSYDGPTGQMYLDFGNTGGGNGLNTDSLNWFDGVFRVKNQNPERERYQYSVWIENPNKKLMFYDRGKEDTPIQNPGNAVEMKTQHGNDGYPSTRGIGVRVDLRDTGPDQKSISEMFGGYDDFVIHVEKSNTQEGGGGHGGNGGSGGSGDGHDHDE